MKDKLKAAYNPKKFNEFGHELIDLITQHLESTQSQKSNANNWKKPSEQLDFWKNYNIDINSPTAFFEDVIKRSINVQHSKYMGHQICPTAPLSALSGLLNSILNNGMAIYEMGPAATAIEKVVIDTINEKIGYNNEADGFITSGGTLANLTALLSARKAMVESDIWSEGMNENLAVIVSSEAHYCVDRSLRIMGFGSQGIIKVPVGNDFSMQTELLEECYSKATAEGLKVISVVGSAPSTSTGIYDDLEEIGEFCKSKKLWFHVDGAHGGAVIFSKKYKHLVKGIREADSVVIDGHKMLMTPSIMTFLLFKNKNDSYATFSQKAQYLWGKDQEEEWYNLAKRTFECTKHMMSIQFYVILKFYGEEIFDQFVTHLYDLGHYLANVIKTKRTDFELAVEPHSNIVCFRYKPKGYTEEELNNINSTIRQKILEDNEYYIVQTALNGKVYLRVTFMNPNTSEKIIDSMLDIVEETYVILS